MSRRGRPEPDPWDHWLLALGLGVLSGVVGGLIWTWAETAWWALPVWIPAGLLVASLALVRASRRPILAAAARITAPIGLAISLLVLGILYWALVTPLGLVARLFGRDPLRRKPDPGARTYWAEHREDRDPDADFRQY